MQRITVKVDQPFMYGGKACRAGERVELDAATAKDLVRRKRASITAEDEPAAPPPTPARATRAKRS